jgi:S1-C subfamily serine protease
MVMKGSPAEKGDLRVRDAVVLCNDQPVENFAQWSEKIRPGAASLDFKVLRKSTPPAVCHVILPADALYPKPPQGLAFTGQKGPAPAPAAAQATAQPAAGEAPAPPKMGFSLRYPNEAEKGTLGGKTGAVIVEVAPEGLAAKALLKAGDILLECNGKPIPAPEGLGSLLVSGENVFLVKRNGQDMTVKVGTTLVTY